MYFTGPTDILNTGNSREVRRFSRMRRTMLTSLSAEIQAAEKVRELTKLRHDADDYNDQETQERSAEPSRRPRPIEMYFIYEVIQKEGKKSAKLRTQVADDFWRRGEQRWGSVVDRLA